MKHLKNFQLFESKSHKLPLPKNQVELDQLSQSPGFQQLKNFNGGCRLIITRNGGVEILSPVDYNFRVSPAGSFYYGGLKVGPKHATDLDTWDKLFDYVYLYFLGTGLNIGTSDSLENFVFHGVINAALYNKIKNSPYYQSILEVARKYLGGVADEIIDKSKAEASTYIEDPTKVLETPSYKFFDKIFSFVPDFSESVVKIKPENKTPFDLFEGMNLDLPSPLGSAITMSFPGSGRPTNWLTSVKTMKGLDKNFLKQITDQYERSLDQAKAFWYIKRANPLDKVACDIVLKLFGECIDNYKEGKDIPKVGAREMNDEISGVFYKWQGSGVDYIKSLVAIINNGKFNSVAEEISYSEKTIEILNSIKSEDPIKYSEIMRELRDVPFISDATKDLYNTSNDVIKGGSLLRRFGVE